jgi:PadR family transcriptional regulator AphA
MTKRSSPGPGGTRSRSRYAVLGLLTIEPMSGYDMKKMIETSVAHFWRESYGNIYPILNRLTTEGLVRRKTQRQTGKPDRHIYTLTARGKSEFLKWLSEPVAEEITRSELLLKLFFGRHLPTRAIAAHLEEFRDRQKHVLGVLRASKAMLNEHHRDHPDFPYWIMTLRRGELTAEARLKWAKESLKQISTEQPSRAVRGVAQSRRKP